MHDDRLLVEGRLERALHQFIRPAQYAARVPLGRSTPWRAPGEPVPVARGARRARTSRSRPVRSPGARPGPPAGSGWRARCRGSGRGGGSRWSSTPASPATGPGFQAEGLVYDAAGRAAQGHPSAQPPCARRRPGRRRRAGAAAAGGGRQSGRAAGRLPPTAARRRPDRRGPAAVPLRLRRPRRARRDRLASGPGHRGAVRADARAARRPARAGTRSCGPWRTCSTRSTCTMWPARRPRRRAELAGRTEPPGARASAHRVSAAGHAHIDSAWLWPLRETVRKASRTFANVTATRRRLPGVGVRLLPGAAVRLGQGAPAAHLGAHQEGGRGRQLGAGRLDVGGVRRQYARRRGAGPADRARQALLPGGAGGGDRGDLAAGLLRLHRRLPAAGRAGRREVVPDPEAVLEPDQQDAAPHLLVGGHRRHPRLHPLPAGRHLQLPACTPPNSPTPSRTSPTRAAPPAPWSPSAGATAGAARPARCWRRRAGCGSLEGSPRVEIEQAVRVLRRRPSEEYGAAGAGLVGRAVPGAAPRLRTPRRRRPSRATGAANTCCGRPSCGPRRRRSGGRRPGTPIRTTPSTGSGRRCCCTSSTTSCRARRSPGCTARPATPTRRVRPSWTGIIATALRALARARRRRTGCRRCSTPRRTTADEIVGSRTRGRGRPCRPASRCMSAATGARRPVGRPPGHGTPSPVRRAAPVRADTGCRRARHHPRQRAAAGDRRRATACSPPCAI